MTRTINMLFLLLGCLQALGCTGETAKETAESVTKKTVEVGKGTLTGVAQGIEEGRKSAESADGAILVSNREELIQHLSVSVLRAEIRPNDNAVYVDLAFSNEGDKPVRVTKLWEERALLLIDQQGFASSIQVLDQASDVTVPERAKLKFSIRFQRSGEAAPAAVRVWGHEVPVPSEKT